MDAHHTNASWRLTASEIYGEVEYFVKHEYDGSDRIFAYIRKVDKYETDNYGQIYFGRFSGLQFIEVIGIDRCVGFFKVDGRNLFYILDRKRIQWCTTIFWTGINITQNFYWIN